MTLEVLKALAVILEFCMNQDSCKNCPMSRSVEKCHLNGNLIPFDKVDGSRLESIFRTARSIEIKNQNG